MYWNKYLIKFKVIRKKYTKRQNSTRNVKNLLFIMYENIYIIFINVNILLIRVWPDRIFICTSFLNREKDEKQRLRKG